jgi:glycosyltransferase involved in cell wall biosynthesis
MGKVISMILNNYLPLVTIGIPTYNRPKELNIAIKSALAQRYKNLEIIISNNCSEDPKVEEVAQHYASQDSRIKYFYQNKNLGHGGNGQFLIDQAQGEYIFILCDDDWISENFIEECIKVFNSNSNCAMVYGRTKLYDADYKLIEETCFRNIESSDYIQRLFDYTQNAIHFRLATALFKTNQFKNIKDFKKNRFCEDQILMSKMLYFGSYIILPHITFHKLNNGSTKDLDSLKKNYNMSDLTCQNIYEKVNETILNAILFDDFYRDRLIESEKFKIAMEVHKLMVNKTTMANLSSKEIIKCLTYSFIKKLKKLYRSEYKSTLHNNLS